MKTEIIHTTRKGESIGVIIFSLYFELFRTIDIFPYKLLRNVMLTVPSELGQPVVIVTLLEAIEGIPDKDYTFLGNDKFPQSLRETTS